ncbi:MAG: ABC transporter permease [Chloroflexota bacterium]
MDHLVRSRPIGAPVARPVGHSSRVARMLPLAGALVVLALLITVWALVARRMSADILPAPASVWQRFLESLRDGAFAPALFTTVDEAGLGWLVALAVGLPLGYAIGSWSSLEDALAPYLAGSQSMPIVAIAPLLVVWLGFGVLPKVVVCALIAFFPILATTAAGIRGIPGELRDAARIYAGDRLSLAMRVEIPLAARGIFAGLKVAAALSVTGAVVGELVSSDQGLGYLLMLGRTNFDTPLMFVAVFALVGLGGLAYFLVSLLERAAIRWDA